MKTNLESVQQIMAPIHMTLGDFLLRMRKVCSCRKNNLYRCGRTRILTACARKRNRKEVLANYNKTRINIGHQHD